MSSSHKPSLLPGLIAGALPLLFLPFICVTLVLQVGGFEELARLANNAGGSFYLLVLVILVFTLLEAFALFLLGQGYEVPLLAPVVLALVPWLAGITGALYSVREMLSVLAVVNPRDRVPILLVGTGEMLSSRLLGAWFSGALLLATAGALLLAAVWRAPPRPEAARSTPSDRMLEAGAALLLALVVLVTASEASTLSEVLTAVANVNPADQSTLLFNAAQELAGSPRLRSGMLGALVLTALVLGGWRLRPGARHIGALVFLGVLALAVAGTLWADGQPLVRMGRTIRDASRLPDQLAQLRLLPLGGDRGPEWIGGLVATPEGFFQLGSPPQPWSAGDERLEATLRKAANSRGYEQPLELLVDARLPVAQLRRLLEAGTRLGMTSLWLVASESPEALASKQPPGSETGHPFLLDMAKTLASRPGVSEVLLPPVAELSDFTPSAQWMGALDAQPRLHISRLTGARQGPGESRELDLRGPETTPTEREENGPVLYLVVTDQAATEDVAHAVRKARAQGFRVLLSATPPPAPAGPGR